MKSLSLNVFFLLTVLFALSSVSKAQVNLDKAYLGKTGNTLFYDLNDQNSIWVIPKYLEATAANEVILNGTEYRVRYHVGLPASSIADLQPQAGSPLIFRAFRATEVTLEQLIDIDPKLKPQILALGDIGMFGENIPYSVSIESKKFPNAAKRTVKRLFDGKQRLVLGRIHYHFSAFRSGQLFQAQSTVAVLTPKSIKELKTKPKNALSEIFSAPANVEIPLLPIDQVYTPQILFNSQSGCWGKGLEDTICLKD